MIERDTADESAPTCDRCGDAFPDGDLLALHRERAHGDDLSSAEREAASAARAADAEALRLFRLKALGAIVLLYFGFLMAYAVVT